MVILVPIGYTNLYRSRFELHQFTVQQCPYHMPSIHTVADSVVQQLSHALPVARDGYVMEHGYIDACTSSTKKHAMQPPTRL